MQAFQPMSVQQTSATMAQPQIGNPNLGTYPPQQGSNPSTPMVPGFVPGVPGLAGGFQNMNVNAVSNAYKGQPVGVNLMAGPPPIDDFEQRIELPAITAVRSY